METKDKKLRRIGYIVVKLNLIREEKTVRDVVTERMGYKFYRKDINLIMELNELLNTTIISQSEIISLSNERVNGMVNNYNKGCGKLIKRDNKGEYVGGGGSNKNKIRYPSKKRSLKVWRTFYSMFPDAAKKDNWDGFRSDKY